MFLPTGYRRRRRILALNTACSAAPLRVALRAQEGDPVGTVVRAFYARGMVQAQRYGSASSTQYSQGLAPLRFAVLEDDAIAKLVVHWPDGRTESRRVTGTEDSIELRH